MDDVMIGPTEEVCIASQLDILLSQRVSETWALQVPGNLPHIVR